ncbi:hypothetical protein O181_043917 [Austropuccinia psidii MF-1]|uniref:Uncharacterized protein n=1 Tax=Austropuccinia psidii MF-1 TaxID=1389203 RepID=A0A9Q3DLH6_9BASI|nr:hypothetical protein [Austropuccinia psidii MF-1]
MSPVHLRNLGFQRNQPEDREGLSRTRRPGGGHLGHSGGWQDTEGNNTHYSIHFPIQKEPQTRGLERHGSTSSAPPTPQRFISMEHGQQEVQPGIPLVRTWSKLPEDLSQRDRLQRPYGNYQRLESHQAVQTPGGSQGVDQTSSPVASHYSGANRSVAKSHHSSQSQEISRRRQGHKGKNKTTINQRMTVCIDNAQHPLIIDSGAHCSIVARNYLDNHFPNWENQLLPTKAKNFKSASGKMSSIGTIIKEIIIPHRKVNIRLNPEFLVLDDAHIQGFLLGTDYQRMYGIDIYNSKNRHITICNKKKKKFSLDIYQLSAQDPLEELLNEFREGQFSTTLRSKQKLSLLKKLRNNIPAFSIGGDPLGKIRGHDIELYLNVERPFPPMLRRPPYPESLETRMEIENISMNSWTWMSSE